MEYIPHDYQRYATEYIETHPISAVLLDMGLGKTVITLTALNDLLFDSFDSHRVLIIAPLRVARDTWPAELRKWDHLKSLTYSVAVGTEKERLNALTRKADIYIINRENVTWLINHNDGLFDFDTVVIDELSSFKSYSSKRFKSLMFVRPIINRIIGLTGTPSPNSLMDLFAEFKLLDKGRRLGRFITHYRSKYFTPDKYNSQMVFSYKPLPGAEQEIYNRISDITISMKSDDYLKLPECISNIVTVELSITELSKYRSLAKDMVLSLDDKTIDAVNAASLTNKLLQMANGAVYDEEHNIHKIHDRKLDALEDLIESANGKPVLIAYWFKHDLQRIKERISVRDIRSAEDIREWNEGKIPVAAIHPASAGHGLNLQAGGSTLIWFSLTWSLEYYQQTNARLHRQGQKSCVVIHHIVTKGTMDEAVLRALQNKETNQNALIDAVKAELESY